MSKKIDDSERKPLVFIADVDGLVERTVVAGRTAGNARYQVYLFLRDVGYPQSFADIKIRRAPNYDSLANYLATRHMCIDLSYADTLKENIENADRS